MKLPEFKAILKSVGEEKKLSPDSEKTKRTVLLEIPERTDQWGDKIKAEPFEMDVIANKIPSADLLALVGKKCVVTQSYLNGYYFQDKEHPDETRTGKSMTLVAIKEFK